MQNKIKIFNNLKFSDSKQSEIKKMGMVLQGITIMQGNRQLNDLYYDQVTMQQVVEKINAMPKGLKARYAHPVEDKDAIGSFIGKVHNARIEGNEVLADLHFSKVAKNAPLYGNLQEYIISMAQDAPQAAGFSIQFSVDVQQTLKLQPVNGALVARVRTMDGLAFVDTPATELGMFGELMVHLCKKEFSKGQSKLLSFIKEQYMEIKQESKQVEVQQVEVAKVQEIQQVKAAIEQPAQAVEAVVEQKTVQLQVALSKKLMEEISLLNVKLEKAVQENAILLAKKKHQVSESQQVQLSQEKVEGTVDVKLAKVRPSLHSFLKGK